MGSAIAACMAGALTSVPPVAQAQGLLGDINGGPTGGVATPLAATWQEYSYSFTAAQANTFITFLFRNAPGTTALDDVSLVAQGSSTNLLQNGNMATRGAASPSIVNTSMLPANWLAVGSSTATLAGGWLGPLNGIVQGDPPDGTHSADTGFWLDGNIHTHDGITQQVATSPGQYTLSFWLGSNTLPDGDTVDTLIYAGGIPLGYLVFTNIDTGQAFYLASDLGISANPVFQGGTLKMDEVAGSYPQNFALTGSAPNTIDQDGNASTFTGVISDARPGTPGSIIIANSSAGGSVTFTGVNTYTGTTTINTGATLALAGAGSIASSAGVIDNGTFDISGGTSGASITTLSGSGGVTLGANTLTLTSAAGTFSGVISGTGGLAIAGGTETLTGTVNAGFLTVNGELRGTGTINAPTTVNGILAPGDSPGTLTFNAPVTLTAGSLTEFDIDGTGTGSGAGNYSRVIVNGAGNTFAAAGILEPLLRGISGSATNTYSPPIGQPFQVISATGGVTGSFTSLTQPAGLAAGTRFDALYAPTTLTLVVTPAQYGNLGVAGLSETGNESAVGRALDAIRPAAGTRMSSADAALFYPLYAQTGSAIPGALNQLSPSIYAAGMMAARDTWYQMADSVSDQLAMRRYGAANANTSPGPNGSTIWANGVGQFTDVSSGTQSAGFHTSVGGAVAGIDMPLPAGAVAGVSVGVAAFRPPATAPPTMERPCSSRSTAACSPGWSSWTGRGHSCTPTRTCGATCRPGAPQRAATAVSTVEACRHKAACILATAPGNWSRPWA